MPKAVRITGRSSSITNSFVNGIVPVIRPSDAEIDEALEVLRMSAEVVCAYCGDRATEWDHLRPLVQNQRPTGYIHEIHNLVPACGKCNQSKGNKPWREWMFGPARLSPKQERFSTSRLAPKRSNDTNHRHDRRRWISPRSSEKNCGSSTGPTIAPCCVRCVSPKKSWSKSEPESRQELKRLLSRD